MKIVSVVGARPQFVKAAMFCMAVRKHNRSGHGKRVRHTLIHTGQHYDPKLSDVFFAELPLPKPQHWLGVGSGTHGAQTAAMLERLEAVLLKEMPDAAVVYGDTNSTIAGALAASKLHVPVAHVEAGLRSFNRQMPEEINRVATDHLSDVLLCPTPTAVYNLEKEGISQGVYRTGDIMLDAVRVFCPLARRGTLLRKLGLRRKQYVLVTIHRAENTDSYEQLRFMVAVVAHLGVPAVLPLHPRVRDRLAQAQYRAFYQELKAATGLSIIPPVSYLDMLHLEENARLILTDSGGVQKEAYFLSVPCITLRAETEWVETLRGGWNRLSSGNSKQTLSVVQSRWERNGLHFRSPDLMSFGNGRAAEKMLVTILRHVAQNRSGASSS